MVRPAAPAAATTADGPAPARGDRPIDRAAGWPAVSDRTFLFLSLAILTAAALVRLYALGMNPFHHDEGINGWFVTNLVRQGEWSYDPANYHGPTLFFFALAAEVVFGLTTEAMRLVTVMFGLGIIALTLALRPFVGSVAALTGAALLTVSPGATYVARYFIHESLVAFFSLAMVVSAFYLVRTRRQRFLVAGAASAALLFATKETGIVHVAVLAIAAATSVVYLRLRGAPAAPPPDGRRRPGRPRRSAVATYSLDPRPYVTLEGAIAAVVAFGALYAAFYSSFLGNPDGLVDSLATFMIWTQTGTEAQVQPFQQYLVWLLRADAPILILGFIGGLIVAWRIPNVASVFIGLWALGVTLAYSLVSYKTPWIALNMLVPLATLAGVGVSEIGRLPWRSIGQRRVAAAAAAVLTGALGISAVQAYDLNFVNYDTEKYPYSYVHTTREMFALIEETRRINAADGSDERSGITIVSPEYWPLPWYYRDYPEAAFFGQIVETQEEMIIARDDQEEDEALRQVIDGRYERRAVYNLRPAVDLVLFVRNDVAAAAGPTR